jgi:hypothetical protein
MSANLLAQALHYAALDEWHVFPCRPRDKRPMTTNGFKDASCEPSVIHGYWTRYPTANIGIALEASGLLVVDIDGPEGIEPYERLGLPCTRRVTTGRREGGEHHYYRVPNGARIKTAVIGPKLDLRGVGAYVIAPPSIHPSGSAYVSNDAPVQSLTMAELRRLLPPQAETSTARVPRPPRDPSSDPLKGIDPPAYCWLLTGKTPNSRGKIPCPLHDDWEGDGGSCHFYPTADEGWYCYGCLKGGDIYSLAQALWGDEPFPNLRLRLVDAVMKGGGDA